MFYYTYITRFRNSTKYYVGRHQSTIHPDKDSYKGSGKWVRSIKDKTKLVREILEFYENEDDLVLAESSLISMHFGQPNCMNMNEKPVGFSSKHNPNKKEEYKNKLRKRMLEDNPMKGKRHTAETLSKMREASTGKAQSTETRKKHSEAMIGKNLGKKRTEEHKRELSIMRKNDYANGVRIPTRPMLGKKHSDTTIEKMKLSQTYRRRKQCEKCGGVFAMCAYTRWHGIHCKN